MNALICLLPVWPFIAAWLLLVSAYRRALLTVRLLALIVAVTVFLATLMLWIGLPNETWLVGLAVSAAFGHAVVILMLPVISPNIMRDFNIKW
jgi:hypothetical protein